MFRLWFVIDRRLAIPCSLHRACKFFLNVILILLFNKLLSFLQGWSFFLIIKPVNADAISGWCLDVLSNYRGNLLMFIWSHYILKLVWWSNILLLVWWWAFWKLTVAPVFLSAISFNSHLWTLLVQIWSVVAEWISVEWATRSCIVFDHIALSWRNWALFSYIRSIWICNMSIRSILAKWTAQLGNLWDKAFSTMPSLSVI